MEDAVKFSIANSSTSKRNNLIFKRSVPIKFNARPDKSMDALIIKAEKESNLGIFTAERMVSFLQKVMVEFEKVEKRDPVTLSKLSNFVEDVIVRSLSGYPN